MDVKKLVSQMTLEEKAGLCSGKDFWHTKDISRLGIPEVMVSDGPHGLRKQDDSADHLGVNESIRAVCFPAGCATAASFDRELVKSMGEALGDECQAEGVSVILGPAVNIKRSPLCGRNFEYFSEDPYLAAEIAASHINGVQSKNVGTSVKHYLANNQENRRMSSSSEVDERTLREIYLAAFEGAVINAKPWTIMCSYNKINGTYASENSKYLTDVLRNEWGFDGYVMSDWGAVNDRVAGLKAGLELEMPASNGLNDIKIAEAVKKGELDEKILDQAVERILNINYKYLENVKPDTQWDKEEHHKLARKIAAECMVLLKNENILPLEKNAEIAFIGKFAEEPRFQGGGSSHINNFKSTSALESVKDLEHIVYARGYDIEEDKIDSALVKEAVEIAEKSQIAVIFAGLPDSFESEGYDRTHMRLPDCQNHLIEAVVAVQPNTIVVLHNGSPVEMPWINKVKGVLEAYLGGQAVGAATVDVLFGEVNPSGRLPETFPYRLEDNSSYLFYGGEKDVVEYREGIFVGYRYYDKKKAEVLFPFGHGLSYTDFEYSNMKVSQDKIKDTEQVTVSIDVKNIGKVEGKEVVQLYISDVESTVIRPVKELKGFEKVNLKPGETKTVSFILNKRSFAYYNQKIQEWHVETGEFDILIGKSSGNIIESTRIFVESARKLQEEVTFNTIFGDIIENKDMEETLKPLVDEMSSVFGGDSNGAISEEMNMAMLKDMPLRGVISFGSGEVNHEKLKEIIEKLNTEAERK